MIKIMALTAAAGFVFAASEKLPEYNIEATCRSDTAVADGTGEKLAGCVRQEQQARGQVARIWPSMKASTRQVCAGDETRAPSYVELLTCVQMSEDASLLK
jgi:hypothetical protein